MLEYAVQEVVDGRLFPGPKRAANEGVEEPLVEAGIPAGVIGPKPLMLTPGAPSATTAAVRPPGPLPRRSSTLLSAALLDSDSALALLAHSAKGTLPGGGPLLVAISPSDRRAKPEECPLPTCYSTISIEAQTPHIWMLDGHY